MYLNYAKNLKKTGGIYLENLTLSLLEAYLDLQKIVKHPTILITQHLQF